MDFYSVVNQRRSVRKFEPDPVPREVLERIVRTGIEAPSGCNMQLRHYVIVDDPELMDRLRSASPALQGAPAAIFVVMDPQATPYGEFWMQDASAAIENMLLAAVAEGYASCWIEGQVRRTEEQLRPLLNVPAPLRIWAILPIGRAAVQPERPAKSPYEDVVHVNGW